MAPAVQAGVEGCDTVTVFSQTVRNIIPSILSHVLRLWACCMNNIKLWWRKKSAGRILMQIWQRCCVPKENLHPLRCLRSDYFYLYMLLFWLLSSSPQPHLGLSRFPWASYFVRWKDNSASIASCLVWVSVFHGQMVWLLVWIICMPTYSSSWITFRIISLCDRLQNSTYREARHTTSLNLSEGEHIYEELSF